MPALSSSLNSPALEKLAGLPDGDGAVLAGPCLAVSTSRGPGLSCRTTAEGFVNAFEPCPVTAVDISMRIQTHLLSGNAAYAAAGFMTINSGMRNTMDGAAAGAGPASPLEPRAASPGRRRLPDLPGQVRPEMRKR